MLQAADELASIVSRGRSAYDGDVALRRAVERCIEVLGEAAKSVSADLRTAQPDVPWTDLARLRDRLSHHYHRVDPDLLWTIAINNVPSVARQLRDLRLDTD
jgi:uncharacterized protein with HEPN domain